MPEANAFAPLVTVNAAEALTKPRLEAILYCDNATRTFDNKYVLFNTFDKFLFKPDDPKVTNVFFLFVRIGGVREGRFQVALYSPENKIVWAVGNEIKSTGVESDDPPQINYLDRVQMAVPIEGVYWFDVSYNGESLGGAPFSIKFIEPEASKDEHRPNDTTGDAQP